MGLRERKKLATRAALGQAAWRLTIELGYEHARVEDIAAAAGVSARTFNNYFPSKEDALLSVGADRGARMVAALRARPEGEPLWEALAHAMSGQFAGGWRGAPGVRPVDQVSAGARGRAAEAARSRSKSR